MNNAEGSLARNEAAQRRSARRGRALVPGLSALALLLSSTGPATALSPMSPRALAGAGACIAADSGKAASQQPEQIAKSMQVFVAERSGSVESISLNRWLGPAAADNMNEMSVNTTPSAADREDLVPFVGADLARSAPLRVMRFRSSPPSDCRFGVGVSFNAAESEKLCGAKFGSCAYRCTEGGCSKN